MILKIFLNILIKMVIQQLQENNLQNLQNILSHLFKKLELKYYIEEEFDICVKFNNIYLRLNY